MNIVKKELDQNNAVVTLRIEKADYSEKVDKTLRDYRKKATIPGFRPGMVPVSLVKKMYGKAVLAEEINKLVSENLYQYIRDNKINILGEPLPSEKEASTFDFDSQEEFEFVFDLGIAPEFEVELTAKDKVNFYKIAVSQEMVDNQVNAHAGRYGKHVQEEIVEEKDMVKGKLLELENGSVKADGIQVEDASLTPAYMKDEAQKALFVGAKKGDVLTFNPQLAFANETEISSMLSISKEAAKAIESDFQITIESITRYKASEVDQELFDKVYGEGAVSGLEGFHEKIKVDLQENLTADSEYKFGMDAQEMLVAKFNNLTFPDAFLKRWVLASNKNMTAEALETDFPKMIADLKWHLIKDKLVKTNDINVGKEEVEEFAKKMARAEFARYGMVGMDDELIVNYAKNMLKKEETVRNFANKVAEDKVFSLVKDKVKLVEKEVSIEEFNKMFEAN
jgi:trigger factor